MSQRERIILIVTIVVLVLGVGFRIMPENILSFGGGQVSGAREVFEENLKLIQRGPAIREAYRRVNTQLPEQLPDTTPEATFSNEVARRLQQKGWERPLVKPAKPTEIKEVEDYYYIDLDISLEGTLEKALDVLKDFQKMGLLIKAFQIEKRNMDADEVALTVTVSRLAKMDEEELRRLKRRKGRS